MKGYFSITDYDWYQFLLKKSKNESLLEVNHWGPGTRGVYLQENTPYFFQLKKPHNRIAGFGFSGPLKKLPLSIVWDSFRENTGCSSYEEMRSRVWKYRRGHEYEEDPLIVSRSILEPIFFDNDQIIPRASDWAPSIVQGKNIDLTLGEGSRIWSDCQIFGRSEERGVRTGVVRENNQARYGAPLLHTPRLGQGTFRVSVRIAYEDSCAISGVRIPQVLEAAHIRPYSKEGPHTVSNGLLLRSDFHKLFDLGYITITRDFRIKLSSMLLETPSLNTDYSMLCGKKIRLPLENVNFPDVQFLDWHGENVFRSR